MSDYKCKECGHVGVYVSEDTRRLDWVEKYMPHSEVVGFSVIGEGFNGSLRAAIDAAMKECLE